MIPNVLSIAGFDPSGGAGIASDIKTFENCKCLGFAVQTGNTIQIENSFLDCFWTQEKVVMHQLKTLLKNYTFHGIKIGLIPSVDFLRNTVQMIKFIQPKAKIIWDPIVASSSGFVVHKNFEEVIPLLKSLFLITPNWNEVSYFTQDDNIEKGLKTIGQLTRVLVKGGHRTEAIGQDMLFFKENCKKFNPKKGKYFPKHGSGCVFSSAITSYIAKGYPLPKAILKAKRYTEKFLSSTTGLLGHHRR